MIAVCNDCLAHFYELFYVIDNFTTKEGAAIFKSWLINNNRVVYIVLRMTYMKMKMQIGKKCE